MITENAGDASRQIRVYEAGIRPRGEDGWGAMAGMVWRHWDLIWQLTKREVVGRYRGAVLGLGWWVIHPLLMLGVYTFAFGYVFRVASLTPPTANRPGIESGQTGIMDFALYAYSGLILASLFTEIAMRSPSVMVQNANLVKKVVFPLEVFGIVQVLSAVIHAGMSFLVLLAAMAVVRGGVPATVVLVPVVVVPVMLIVVGMAWVLLWLGAVVRDIAQGVGVAAMILIYLSPVFYAMDMIGNRAVRGAIRMNPLTVPLVSFRRVLAGQMPEWGWLGGYFLVSLAVAWAGFSLFQRGKRGMADVV